MTPLPLDPKLLPTLAELNETQKQIAEFRKKLDLMTGPVSNLSLVAKNTKRAGESQQLWRATRESRNNFWIKLAKQRNEIASAGQWRSYRGLAREASRVAWCLVRMHLAVALYTCHIVGVFKFTQAEGRLLRAWGV